MRVLRWAGLLLFAVSAFAYATEIPLDTSSLANWSKLGVPMVSRKTSFHVVSVDGKPAIHIQSNNGASSLVYDRVFKTYATPILSFSWKAMNVLAKGNIEHKEGDDYVLRIYVMFPYEPARLSLMERLRYEAAKRLLGYYPPSEILSYVWANRSHRREPLPSPFSTRGMTYFPDAGSAHLDQWRSHTVNIVSDYRRAFGVAPEQTFRLAIMGDSDNTHGETNGYIRSIRLSSK